MGEIIPLLLLSILVTALAWRGGFFSCKEHEEPPPIRLRSVLLAFLLYFSTVLLILPVIYLLSLRLLTGSWPNIAHLTASLSPSLITRLEILSFLVIFALFLLYLRALGKGFAQKHFFPKKNWMHQIGLGILGLLISYPVVMFVNKVAEKLMTTFWQESTVQQVAVEQLKAARETPFLFALLSLLIITAVPFVEELLFRGFLQGYLRRFLSAPFSIGLTSLIFSLFHFAAKQGASNFALLLSLFTLSCYLGFLYERERHLGAPIGMHAAFNAVTIISLLTQ